MDEIRLVNAIPLEKEMLEYAQYIGRETTNECESTAESCADMVSGAPTIDPESLPPHWRKSAETPPTRKDADDFGRIVVWGSAVRHVDLTYWYNAVQYPEVIPFWMPCPKPPKEQDSEVCDNG